MAAQTASQTGERAPGFFARTMEWLQGVRSEMRKVTWPDLPQVRSATISIIIFVLVIALVITILDTVLQAILVKGIPSLFSGR